MTKRSDEFDGATRNALFLAARIHTCDPRRPWAEALAVENGRIAAVGMRDELLHANRGRLPIVSLDGPLVLPGLVDPHNHVLEGARASLFETQFAPDVDFAGILDAVEQAARDTQRSEWIVGGAFAIGRCPEMFTAAGRAALDAASLGRPVLLRDLSLHARFANSAALARAGVDDTTKDPDVGRFVRDADGRLTGLAFEYATNSLEEAVPPLSDDEWIACARKSVALLNAVGVTGFGLAVASARTLQALKSLDERGGLTARVAGYIAMTPLLLAFERDGIGEMLIARRDEFRSARINPDCAKFFMDGVPLQRTAAFIDPYSEDGDKRSESCGASAYATDDLAARIGRLDDLGLSVKVHAIGDRAIRDTLDAIEIVRRSNPGSRARHTIAHMQFARDDDVVRLKRLGVGADLCPPMWFPLANEPAFRAALGDDRVERSWPVRDMVASGALVAVGSDWPAISRFPNPWPGLAALTTRRNPFAPVPGQLGPEQAIDIQTAVHLSSAAGAEMIGFGAEAGQLRVGHSADFIVLDRDIFACDATAVAGTSVVQTWFEGACVHDARAKA